MFEKLIAGLTVDDDSKVRYLVSKLEGAAQQWLLGQGDKWASWSYSELRAQLTRHFKGESSVYQRKLLSLKCTQDLAKFHDEFTAAAAAAMPTMGEAWVREQYLSAVQPPELALFLRARADQGLQALMATALDLDADMKRTKIAARPTIPSSSTGPSTRPQDPNRKPCTECKKWKYVWDTCPQCGAPPTQKKGDRPASKPMPRRRVQELTVQEVSHPEPQSDEESEGLAEGEGFVEAGYFASEE